jgi:hypothetical protein
MSELVQVAAVTIDQEDAIIVAAICIAVAAIAFALFYFRRA